MNDVTIKLYDNTLFIIGYINFNNLEELLNNCIKKTNNIKHLNVNLKNLYKPNSAALLFIINYIRHAIKNNQIIKFIEIPELLSELSKVYNLKNIINR